MLQANTTTSNDTPADDSSSLLSLETKYRLKNKLISQRVTTTISRVKLELETGRSTLNKLESEKPIEHQTDTAEIDLDLNESQTTRKYGVAVKDDKSKVRKANLEVEATMVDGIYIGKLATTRLETTKTNLLTKQIEMLTRQLHDVTNSLAESKLHSVDVSEQLARALKMRDVGVKENTRIGLELKGVCSVVEELKAENLRLKREVDEMARESKKTEMETNRLNVRLNRTLSDMNDSKLAKLADASSDRSHVTNSRDTASVLMAENKQLLKEKNELATAIVKQGKLIAVLRKQKMHIVAAKVLEFTEQEFMRAIKLD